MRRGQPEVPAVRYRTDCEGRPGYIGSWGVDWSAAWPAAA